MIGLFCPTEFESHVTRSRGGHASARACTRTSTPTGCKGDEGVITDARIAAEMIGLCEAALGIGSGIIAEEGAPVYEADDRLDLARAMTNVTNVDLARALAEWRDLRKSPRRKADDRLDLARAMTNVTNVDLALVLRKIADRLETGDAASE